MLPGLGWSDTAIGYLAPATTAGSIVFLLTGIPLMRRAGPIRALQMGMLVGAFGVAVLAFPLFVAPLIASFLLGVGYGPSTPAGNEVPSGDPGDCSYLRGRFGGSGRMLRSDRRAPTPVSVQCA
jgi:MFS family permease